MGTKPITPGPGQAPKLPMELIARLESFSTLRDNWDSYGGKPISRQAIDTAKRIVDGIHAVPTPHGGVQLELDYAGLRVAVEIGPDGEPCLMVADMT